MLRELSLKHGLKEVDTVMAKDSMDDGSRIRLALTIDRAAGTAVFDFSGTDEEMLGNCNAPRSITSSAVIYCLRCLVNSEIPLNQGCLNPIKIILPPNSLLNPSARAAVVGGNVETSQRITDVVLLAF
jgi:5-oxoprolinase (ATP-hydrolysing)